MTKSLKRDTVPHSTERYHIHIYIYIYIYRRLGDESNREIISCRAVRCVRACARSGCRMGIRLNSARGPFPFSLLAPGGFPLFLEKLKWGVVKSSEFQWIPVISSCTKCYTVVRGCTKLYKVVQSGAEWYKVVQSRTKWYEVVLVQSDTEWYKVVPSGTKWYRVMQSGTKC